VWAATETPEESAVFILLIEEGVTVLDQCKQCI
jgi:hypothetical protein